MSNLRPAAPEELPPDLSFLFAIEEVTPAFERQGRRDSGPPFFHWLPPNRYHGLQSHAPVQVYRWCNGRVYRAGRGSVPASLTGGGCLHRSATMFTQCPDTMHFLAVCFDARTTAVEESELGEWRELGFAHDEHPDNEDYAYSSLRVPAGQRSLAARCNSSWMQLFTQQHHWNQHRNGSPAYHNAGVTGELPLILALVAFSCPPERLDAVLTNHVALRTWIPHPYPNGLIEHRGVVATVWLDPVHPLASSHNGRAALRDSLSRLERGRYGAFFDP